MVSSTAHHNLLMLLPLTSAVMTLQWHHIGRNGISSHQPQVCFMQPFIQAQIKEKKRSSASLAFVSGIHRWTVNFPHKRPLTRKMFPFDYVIMFTSLYIFSITELYQDLIFMGILDIKASVLSFRHITVMSHEYSSILKQSNWLFTNWFRVYGGGLPT